MKILLTAANGQVGWELARTLATLGDVTATTRATLDLGSESAIRHAIETLRPAIVVNAAAYTAVDAAESNEPAARWLNAEVPRILAEEASLCGAWLVHYSTDYVFDGISVRPYLETDPIAPLGVYGRTKADGEAFVRAACDRHLIFRLSWVYGTRGRNFLRTVQELGAGDKPLRVVADQFGCPTWSRMAAEATATVLAQRPDVGHAGTYHLTSVNSCSWKQFAEAILRHSTSQQLPIRTVRPVTAADYPTPAKRPAYSVLNSDSAERTFGVRLPSWESQLERCLEK